MAYTKYLRFVLIAGVFAIPFIPFVVSSGSYFPFITGKNFTFRILVELLAGLTIIVALKDTEYRPRFSWIAVAVVALFAAATLSTLTSVDPVKSFWSNFERMEGLLGLLHMVLWFFIASIVLSAENLLVRFLQVSIFASVCMALFGIFQLLGFATINQGGVRLDGTFGNAIYLAVYMLFHIFFTLFLLLRHKGEQYMYWLYGGAIVLQTIALYYTATRSATLGLIGGLFVTALSIAWFERERSIVRKSAYVGIGVLVAIVLGVFLIRNIPAAQQNPILGRFTSLSFTENTVKSRFMIWNMAIEGFTEKPITGWGMENFNYVFNKNYNPKMYAQEQWFDRAHNAYLDWLVSTGLLGFLAFIALFLLAAYAFMTAEGLKPSERAVFLGLLSAYAFHSFFVFDNLMSSVYFFFLLSFAHGLTKKKLPGSIWLTKPAGEGLWYAGSTGAVIAVACGIYFLNMPGLATAEGLIDGLSPQKQVTNSAGAVTTVQKDPKENIAALEAAASDNPMGRQEVVEQILQVTSTVAATPNVNPQIRDAFVALAKRRGAAFLQERKDDARMELFYGAFLDQLKDFDGARPHLEKAHALSPKKQTILFELGINNYLQSGNNAAGVAALKEAFELEPAFPEARIIYAIALMGLGDAAQSDELLIEGFGSVIIDDNRLLRAYTDMKRYDRVVQIWQLRVQTAPNNLDNQASLALAYKAAGNPAAGMNVLREIDKKAPQYHDTLVKMAKDEFGQVL